MTKKHIAFLVFISIMFFALSNALKSLTAWENAANDLFGDDISQSDKETICSGFDCKDWGELCSIVGQKKRFCKRQCKKWKKYEKSYFKWGKKCAKEKKKSKKKGKKKSKKEEKACNKMDAFQEKVDGQYAWLESFYEKYCSFQGCPSSTYSSIGGENLADGGSCSPASDGDTCTVACAEPYVLKSGNLTWTCSGNTWTGNTVCGGCPMDLAPSSKNLKTNSCPEAKPGDSCTLECMDGYRLKAGPESLKRVCKADGSWDQYPQCEIFCPAEESGLSGNTVGDCPDSDVSGTCVSSCAEGTVLKTGSLSRTCQSSGSWSPENFANCGCDDNEVCHGGVAHSLEWFDCSAPVRVVAEGHHQSADGLPLQCDNSDPRSCGPADNLNAIVLKPFPSSDGSSTVPWSDLGVTVRYSLTGGGDLKKLITIDKNTGILSFQVIFLSFSFSLLFF